MLKLIHADLFKVFHRSAFYIMLAVLSGFAAVLVVMMFRDSEVSISNVYSMAPLLLPYPAALLPIITQFTLGEEYRERTVKNTIEYGTGRGLYFSSKLISTIILGAILTAAVYGVYFGTASIIAPSGEGVASVLAADVFSRIGAAFTVYIAAAAMSMFLLTVFGRSSMAIFAYYGILYFTGPLLMLFHLDNLKPYLLKTQLAVLSGRNTPDFLFILMVSAVTSAVFFAVGLTVLKKKDMA